MLMVNKQSVRLAQLKHLEEGQPPSLAPSKGDKICLPAPLEPTNEMVASCLFKCLSVKHST